MYEEVLNNHITNESDVIKVAIEQYQEKQMKTRAIDAKPDDYLSITQVWMKMAASRILFQRVC